VSETPTPESVPSREPLPTPSPSAEPPKEFRRRFRPADVVPYIPALIPAAIIVAILVVLIEASSFTNFGLSFWTANWNPTRTPSEGGPVYGILVFIVGSFLTAVPALVLAMLIGLGLAIASTTYLPRFITQFLDPFVDLLAGIPSIVYGIWGLVFLAPIFGSKLNPWVSQRLSFVPGFAGPIPGDGFGIPLTVFVLTLMVLPITTLLMRDALRSVPRDLWEAGLGAGATRWETTRRVAIPYAFRGIVSAGFLGFARAFGETIAVAMLLNLEPSYPINAFGGTSTMAAVMLTQIDSAFGNGQFEAALAEMAIVLLGISLVVNLVGRRLVTQLSTYEVAGL
jgi:phosphate transport system permease protein